MEIPGRLVFRDLRAPDPTDGVMRESVNQEVNALRR